MGMNLYRHPRNLYTALAVLLFVPAVGAWAQGGAAPAPASASATKIGILNVKEAITSTAEGKQANVQLQAQFTPQTTELDNMQRQMQDLQNQLANGARTLSADAQASLQAKGQLLQRQFQRKQDDLNDQLTAAQNDIVDGIGRKMLDVLDKYAKEKGYAVILDSSAQGTPVVYGATTLDVTDDVIRLYDQAYPVKAAAPAAPATRAPASAPAQPKPAAPAAPAPAK
jgi:outer membrane protein